jgi:hypothetical protein
VWRNFITAILYSFSIFLELISPGNKKAVQTADSLPICIDIDVLQGHYFLLSERNGVLENLQSFINFLFCDA